MGKVRIVEVPVYVRPLTQRDIEDMRADGTLKDQHFLIRLMAKASEKQTKD